MSLGHWDEVGRNLVRLGNTTPDKWPDEERGFIKDEIRSHLKAAMKDGTFEKIKTVQSFLHPAGILIHMDRIKG